MQSPRRSNRLASSILESKAQLPIRHSQHLRHPASSTATSPENRFHARSDKINASRSRGQVFARRFSTHICHA
jgi:hypothetical protein